MKKRPNPKARGEKTEAIIIAELVKKDIAISLPFGDNQRYDLIMDTADRGLVRVQCKTGRLKNGRITFNTVSTRINANGYYTRDYVGDIEYFAVYCYENDTVYLVPIEDIAKSKTALRITPPLNHQKAGIRWAKDYEL